MATSESWAAGVHKGCFALMQISLAPLLRSSLVLDASIASRTAHEAVFVCLEVAKPSDEGVVGLSESTRVL